MPSLTSEIGINIYLLIHYILDLSLVSSNYIILFSPICINGMHEEYQQMEGHNLYNVENYFTL